MGNTRSYIAGHHGMVGSAVVRQLEAKGGYEIITRTHAELDLTNHQAVDDFFLQEEIDQPLARSEGEIHALLPFNLKTKISSERGNTGVAQTLTTRQ